MPVARVRLSPTMSGLVRRVHDGTSGIDWRQRETGESVPVGSAQNGYSVTNVDLVRPAHYTCPFVRADLTDMGQAMEVLHQVDDRHRGVDAVVHLGAMPAPGLAPGSELFRNNTLSTYNVFGAARHFGIQTSCQPPAKPSSAYPLISRRRMFPSTRNIRPVPSRRMRWQGHGRGNGAAVLPLGAGDENRQPPLLKCHVRPDYAAFPTFDDTPGLRKWNLWSYIDARDAAQAVRKALEVQFKGAEVFIIANPDTVMSTPTRELVDAFYPESLAPPRWGRSIPPSPSTRPAGSSASTPNSRWRSEATGAHRR